MRSKASKQSKFMQIIFGLIKILSNARDFYMKKIQDCAGRIGNYDSSVICPTSQVVHLSKSFSVNSSKPTDDEEFMKLLRAASRKNMDSKVRLNLYWQNQRKQTSMHNVRMGRSYSVGVRKMQRIDEDKPCHVFEEAGSRPEFWYPRSRSHVAKRNLLS